MPVQNMQGLKNKVDGLMEEGKFFVVDHELLAVCVERFSDR